MTYNQSMKIIDNLDNLKISWKCQQKSTNFIKKGLMNNFESYEIVRNFLKLYCRCFCLPEGSHNIAAGGYGVPVDNIDRSCLEFKQCYKCLIAEHAGDFKGIPDGTECRGEDHGYKMNLTTENGTNKITCLNPVGTCRRNI